MAARKLKSNPVSPEIPQDKPGGNTSWKAGVPANGWYRYPDNWWRDLPRLQRGLYQRMLIEYVWGSMVPRDKDGAMPEWSPWLSYVDMAAVFRCSPEQLRDDAKNASDRGLMTRQEVRGRVRFKIAWERWPNLKDYAPEKPVEMPKKPRVAPSSRWLAGVNVKPGASYDFTVPELPADFRLQKISLRNTGESGELVFAGGGPAEGGILVLEAQSNAENESIKSATSGVERDSTPVRRRGRRRGADISESAGNRVMEPSLPRSGDTVPGVGENGSGRKGDIDGLPQDDASIHECIRILETHGTVVRSSFLAWFRGLGAHSKRVLDAVIAINAVEKSRPVNWILGMVPKYLDGSYAPSQPKKKVSERDQRAYDALNEMLGKRGKIA